MTDKRFYILLPFIFLYTYSIGAPQRNDDLIVETFNGKIEGTLNSTPTHEYYSFRGIPYAKPPTGELRFKAPVPADTWTGTLKATKDANTCMQKNYLFYQHPAVEGSEDCLYLNVYVPKIPCKDTKLPVIVFIHYGGFIGGSSRSTLLGPDYFMNKSNVILVTFNYRLGIFGFYSSLDDEAPGNWAFKDQVMALRWVKQNIEFFGGDPDKVTLAGQSAGAGAVHHHILSPSSAGLFQQAISSSGSALALWAKPFNELQAGIFRAVAQAAECNATADSATIINCMREVTAEKLVGAADVFKYFAIEPLTVYSAVIEERTERNPEPFLEQDPMQIILSGNFQKIPWIIGINQDDGILRSSPITRQADNLKILNQNIDALLPQMLLLGGSVPANNTMQLWEDIADFYLAGKTITAVQPKTIQGLTDLYTDRSFVYGSYQTALLHASKGHSPIWFYNFAYRGDLTFGDMFAATNETIDFKWGTSHCDDLIYLFKAPEILPDYPESDNVMGRILMKFWTNFAKHGNPTPCTTKVCTNLWDPMPSNSKSKNFVNSELHYLNISGPTTNQAYSVSMEMRNDLYPERMAFWQSKDLYENIGFN